MRYRLIGENNLSNVKETILTNRGVGNIHEYLNISEKSLVEYSKLNNIQKGINLINSCIELEMPIDIVVDCDVDGMTSSAMMYDYITNKIGYKNVRYLLHTGKQHGLSDDILKQIGNEPSLIILPDAGTNDTEQCKKLSENGFKTLVIDHHEKERDNEYAVIINNQTSDYDNKNLCGAGVVYKFLKAFDDEMWTEYSDEYIDLVSLGNISDVMDLRSCETKYLVDAGLRNIKNKFFKALVKKQSFSISNTECPSITDVSFYITPLINAMIRVGKQEEKELMFRAFIGDNEEFEYAPRKSKKNPNPQPVMEDIYTRVARLCGNAKARQSKEQEKSVKFVVDKWSKYNDNNLIFFANITDAIDSELTGLVAMKIADLYQKPVLLLRHDKKRSSEDTKIFSGSARNVNNGYIENLKDELSSSGLFIETVGHQGAFGASIGNKNIPLAISYFNEKFKDVDMSKVYDVDFIFDGEVPYKFIKEVESIRKLFSSNVKEPMIAVENVTVAIDSIYKMGAEGKHVKFFYNDVSYILFNAKDNDSIIKSHETGEEIRINLVGRVSINMYNNVATPQVTITEYEVI